MMALTEVYCLVNRARGMEVMLTFKMCTFELNSKVFDGLPVTEDHLILLSQYHSCYLQKI